MKHYDYGGQLKFLKIMEGVQIEIKKIIGGCPSLH